MTPSLPSPSPILTADTARALACAALVVCSVLAIGAGTAAATPPVETDADDLDRGVVWAGQTIVATDGDFHDGEVVELREVTDSSAGEVESSSFVRELTVEDDAVEFDTDELEGEYILRAEAGDSPIFEVVVQELTVSWEETDVTTGDEVDVEFDSNRGDYNVTVAADGLDADQLRALFVTHPGSDVTEIDDPDHLPLDRLDYDRDAGGVDSFNGDGYVGLDFADVDQSDGIVADFAHLEDEEGIDEGSYEFEFMVTDTGVTDPHTVDADEEDPDATFVDPGADDEDEDADEDEPATVDLEATVTDEAGDPIADATVTADEETATTDADGVATMALADGEYELAVSAAGYEDVTKTVTVDGADVTVAVTLVAEDDAADDADDVPDETDDAVDDVDDEVDDAEPEDDEPVDDEQPGFGIAVALLAALAVAMWLGRR